MLLIHLPLLQLLGLLGAVVLRLAMTAAAVVVVVGGVVVVICPAQSPLRTFERLHWVLRPTQWPLTSAGRWYPC